jgi:GMP synthase-like glutamine amidotransferase
MHIALLDTNTDDSSFGRSHPDEAAKFRALMAPVAPDWQITGYRTYLDEFPETLEGLDGIMISGSIASVNDDAPWIDRLMQLIREARDRGTPVFGACFGHQAVAKALGGEVGYNPQGWVLGRYETQVQDPAPWMDGAAPTMALHAAHKEQVLVPPPGASTHAGTPEVPHGHMSVGPLIFSTQYHPELSGDFMRGLFGHMEGSVAPSVLENARASMTGPVDNRLMADWISAFFRQSKERVNPAPPADPSR